MSTATEFIFSEIGNQSLSKELKEIEEKFNTLSKATMTRYAVAQTPKEIVWRLNKAKLYHYIPTVEKCKSEPILLVYALMNRPYIFDLRPNNSFVEYLINKGYDVYLLDWGEPTIEDKYLNLDDYVLDYLPRVIRKVKSISGVDNFTIISWCIGAILSTSYAALRPNDGLKNLVVLTAPLDFSNKKAGGFIGWVTEKNFDVDKILTRFGNMPGEMIDYGARALKPIDNYVINYIKLWDNIDKPAVVEAWHAMSTWVNDIIPMTGGFYRQLIKNLYNENQLFFGSLLIKGEKVLLEKISANFLNVIAEDDHITPPCQSETVMQKISSIDKETLKLPGGHIGMMAGSAAMKSTWPKIEAWLSKRIK